MLTIAPRHAAPIPSFAEARVPEQFFMRRRSIFQCACTIHTHTYMSPVPSLSRSLSFRRGRPTCGSVVPVDHEAKTISIIDSKKVTEFGTTKLSVLSALNHSASLKVFQGSRAASSLVALVDSSCRPAADRRLGSPRGTTSMHATPMATGRRCIGLPCVGTQGVLRIFLMLARRSMLSTAMAGRPPISRRAANRWRC